jgi:hypothetical protein
MRQKKESAYDFLIDRAIDTADFEWAKELVEEKNKQTNTAYTIDDIGCEYGILDNGVIRKIRGVTESEFIYEVLVKLPTTITYKNKLVEYVPQTMTDKVFLYGYFKGAMQSSLWGKPTF